MNTLAIQDIEENLNGLHVISKQNATQSPKIVKLTSREEYQPFQIPPNFRQAQEHQIQIILLEFHVFCKVQHVEFTGIQLRIQENLSSINLFKKQEFYLNKPNQQYYLFQFYQKACLVGLEGEKESQKNICICCDRNVDKKLINLNCSGYPLYFSFLKYCEIFLSLILIFSGGFNMLTNAIYGTDCQDSNPSDATSSDSTSSDSTSSDSTSSDSNDSDICKKNWITLLSLGNKQDQKKLMFIQEILNLVTIFIVIGLLQIFRRYQRKLDMECDEADISANDYTLLFENIPLEFDAMNNDYDDDLKFFIETSVKQKVFSLRGVGDQSGVSDIEVIKINLCYNLLEQQEIVNKHSKLIKKKQKTMKLISKGKIADESVIKKINDKISAVDSKLMQFQEKFIDGKGKEFMKKYFVGKAFVTFKTEQMKEAVLDIYEDPKLSKDVPFHDKVLKAKQAPYPTDVYWENLHIVESEKTKRFFKGFGISILSLAACAVSIYLLLLLQKSQSNDSGTSGNSALIQSIAILLSISITLLNVALSAVLKYLTQLEGCYTRTEYNISIAKKMAWATFINTALIQFFIEVVFNSKSKFGVIFAEGGLAYNQNYVFISNMIVPFITESLDVPRIVKKMKIKYFLKKQSNCFLTQAQLNDLYERPEYNISQQYAVNLKTMFIVAFYSPILPIGIVYSMIAIFLIYWVDKFNILRRKTIKFSQSAELSIEMTEMIEYILPIYSISNTLFFLYIIGAEGVTALSWIGLAIGIIHCALPMQEWNEKLFKIPEAPPNTMDYEKAQNIFQTDYDKENPATQLIARRKYLSHDNIQHQNQNNYKPQQATPGVDNQKKQLEVQDLDDYAETQQQNVERININSKLNMSYQEDLNSTHGISKNIKTPQSKQKNPQQQPFINMNADTTQGNPKGSNFTSHFNTNNH